MDAGEPRAPYGVLAGLQIAGGGAILVFGVFGAPASERPADLLAGPLAILLGVLSATVLNRLGRWALITSLVASAFLMGFLSVMAQSGQAQMGAGFGFVIVALLGGTWLERWALALFQFVLLTILVASYLMNPVLSNPLFLGVIAVVSIMVSVAISIVVTGSRTATDQYRRMAERLDAVWNSQLDPFLILTPRLLPDGTIQDLRITEANDAARAVFGHPSDIEGIDLRSFLPEELSDDVVFRLVHCLETGEPLILHEHPLLTDPHLGPRLYDIRAYRADDVLALTWQDVTERAGAQQDLERRARYDTLTGCLSRSEGIMRLEGAMTGRRSSEPLPLALFCDLDNFKQINDSHGHAMGDLVLRESAARLASCVRDGDLVIRAGGDEFVIVLMGVESIETGVTVAEKIRSSLTEPIVTRDAIVSVTASIGVAQAEPGQSVDDLLALADRAMYRAKQAGRNRITVAGPEPVQGF